MTGSLDRDRLGRLLDALNDRLRRANVRASLYLVGGAAMLLAYGRTRATSDVDVRIDAATEAVTAAVADVAAEHGLEYDWLNQHAVACIPGAADRRAPTLYNTPNLVITGASAEHLLAMKLEAGRRTDVDDIRMLLDRLCIDEPAEAARIHAHLFPASARRERVERPAASHAPPRTARGGALTRFL